jgi:hypothetical protein
MLRIQGNLRYFLVTFGLTLIFLVQILGINGNSMVLDYNFLPFKAIFGFLVILYFAVFSLGLVWNENAAKVIAQKTIFNGIFYGYSLAYLSVVNTSKLFVLGSGISSSIAAVGLILTSIAINFNLLKTKTLKIDNALIAILIFVVSLVNIGFVFSKSLDIGSYRVFYESYLNWIFAVPKFWWIVLNSMVISGIICLKNMFNIVEFLVNFYIIGFISILFSYLIFNNNFSYWHIALLITIFGNYVLNYYQIAKFPNDPNKFWRYLFSSLYHITMILVVLLVVV